MNDKKCENTSKKILIIVLTAVIAACLGIAVAAIINSPSRKVSRGIELAERYLSEQNYEQAVAEYENVLEIDPTNVDVYLGLAEIYEKTGDTDKAVEILEQGVEKTNADRLPTCTKCSF